MSPVPAALRHTARRCRSAAARAVVLGWIGLAAGLGGCASAPPAVSKPHSTTLADTAGTRIAVALRPLLAREPRLSGIVPLPDGLDAFAARTLLIETAERSIDLQTYILHDDATGTLLVEKLLGAADRGVRVRLLLDDNNTFGLDPLLRLLDDHVNIEVRLFNPFAQRHLRLGALLADFERLNRRMHNKSLTVDNSASIVGGRNIGDAYFESHMDTSFADLDVVVIGPTVNEISEDFDRYWNSEPAYPAAQLLAGTTALDPDVFELQARDALSAPEAAPHRGEILGAPEVHALLAGQGQPYWARVRLVSDDPEKVLHPPERTDMQLMPRLQAAMGTPQHSLDLVSPYFVPGELGTATLAALAGRGVKVRVLTNSLAATDVVIVHAGYAKRREALLRAGVRLFEFKPAPGARAALKQPSDSRVPGGNSRASLHAKTFAADDQRLFVGSLNLDPRSARLNTEMGMVILSPALATQLSQAFDKTVPANAYEIRLSPEGRLQWIDSDGRVRTGEPGAGWLRRALVEVLSWFPIEWLL